MHMTQILFEQKQNMARGISTAHAACITCCVHMKLYSAVVLLRMCIPTILKLTTPSQWKGENNNSMPEAEKNYSHDTKN